MQDIVGNIDIWQFNLFKRGFHAIFVYVGLNYLPKP